MQLKHISLDNLSVSALNMRQSRKAPDVADILPSVRERGVLVPLLVRPNGSAQTYEIVAGRRRYYAAKTVAKEQGTEIKLPCAVMEAGDDADAIEASLIENVARRDADPMTEYETFVKLLGEGRSVAEIAATFALKERQVQQRLALGNLLPKIRQAYRDGKIDAGTAETLTLASPARQTEWLALFSNPHKQAPRGYGLKGWLLGGEIIPTK